MGTYRAGSPDVLKSGVRTAEILGMTGTAPPRLRTARPRWSAASVRRRRLVLGATTTLLGGALAVPAVADLLPELSPPAQVRTVAVGGLGVQYDGTVHSWAEIQGLQRSGLASVTVVDRATAQATGLAHAFDTAAEAEAWSCVTVGTGCPADR